MTKLEKLERFMDSLDSEDAFFTTGSADEDLEMVTGVIRVQGYWAGVRFRYFFDEDFNLIKMEERRFG